MTKLQQVKSSVTIPMYFYNIILPQKSSYYDDYTVDFEARPVAKCPLHDEDTPSMRYYEETNTFFCFGCRAGGDVIELHRRYVERETGDKPSLDDTIEFLYNFFIKGRENTSIRVKTGERKEGVSSNVEIARYNKYVNNLELQILADSHLDLDIKKKIWQAIDEVSLLVGLDISNAIEGMQYIKNVVFREVK